MDKNDHPRRNAALIARDIIGVVFIFLVVFISVLFIVLNFNTEESNMVVSDRYNAFGENWQMELDGETQVVDLPEWINADSGDTIRLTRVLPPLSPFYTLVTRNYHQTLTVIVDGETIYQFPQQGAMSSETLITDDWNMIQLNQDMTGKRITLEFKTGQYGFTGFINPIYIGEDNSIIQYIRADTAFPYAMSISVIAIGFILIVIGSIYSRYREDKTQIMMGLMLMAFGVWLTNRAKMPILLVGSSVKYFLAFICLMTVPVLIIQYAGDRFKTARQDMHVAMTFSALAFMAVLFVVIPARNYPLDRAVRFVYAAILIAIIYVTVWLWLFSFGKYSKNLTNIELNANRLELYATVLLIAGTLFGVLRDVILNKNEQWTDVGALPKLFVNIYAISQILIHTYKSYHGVIEREVIQSKLHDSQMELMMGQIQPHFVFNTLSSIRTLVKVDPDVAYNMLYDFSNYLRANVDNITNLSGISFASEVEHIMSYVNIEKVRF